MINYVVDFLREDWKRGKQYRREHNPRFCNACGATISFPILGGFDVYSYPTYGKVTVHLCSKCNQDYKEYERIINKVGSKIEVFEAIRCNGKK